MRAQLTHDQGQFELPDAPKDAISAVEFSPHDSTKLLVSSWDKHVSLYEAHAESDARLIRHFVHRAPVLNGCFGADDNEAYSVGLDWDVRR